LLGFLPVNVGACQIRATTGKDFMTPSEPTIPDLEASSSSSAVPPSEPTEHSPADIVIHDRGRRQLTVRTNPTTMPGAIVIHRWARIPSDRDRVVAVLDADNARGLSDALQWAARIAEPRSLNLT
jgi:hypothetical protein